MDADCDAGFVCSRSRFLELICVQCVNRVGTEYRDDTTVRSLPPADELESFSDRVAGVLGVRASLIDDRRRYHCAHSTRFDDIGNYVRKVVHIDERRRAAANHLPAGELRADADEFSVDEFDFGRKSTNA